MMHTAAPLPPPPAVVNPDATVPPGCAAGNGSTPRTSPRKTSSPALVSAHHERSTTGMGAGHFPALSKRAASIQSHSTSRATVPQPGQRSSVAATGATASNPVHSRVIAEGEEFNGGDYPPRRCSSVAAAPVAAALQPSRPQIAHTPSPLDINLVIPPPLDKNYHNLSPHPSSWLIGGHWKHFSATTTLGGKDASVLAFEKKANVKAPARLGRINRLGLLDLLRYDVSQLVSLAHPRILRTQHPLAENKEWVAFACEPIHLSLDQMFVVDEEAVLEKLEMKLGVLQIIEGLSYLHNSAKILHGNLTPASIYVTGTQLWKIGGFAFSVCAGKQPNQYPCYPWTKRLPPCLQPDLDFLAPEYLAPNNQFVSTAADVFSLGVLICWIYSHGKKLIDTNNNLESYSIIVEQLDVALELIANELGPDLKEHLVKVVSKGVEQRPAVQMLALIKHFDDPPLAALRQLDDIAQEFDPAHKVIFLSQTLHNALPGIPEPLWFRRVLQRFNEHLIDSTDLYPAILRPLMYILSNCESHNIHRLRPWFKRILEKRHDKALAQCILESMSVVFRRLNDAELEDQCLELLLFSLTGNDPIVKQVAVRSIVPIVDFIPLRFINKHLIPVFLSLAPFFEGHIPRQIDLLVTIGHLSDRCDSATLHSLLSVASVCSALHPAIVHSKSRLVQRILTCDVSRLRDTQIISNHLLNPLVLGLALPEMSPAHFDDVMSSSRILLDITEQLRYDSDDFKAKAQGNGRLCSRRVSMSSNHLPRLLITAARPSISGDGRKMSFLSADGRLEDRGRRDSKDSRGSIQSDVSIRLGNDGSDLSDESAAADAAGHRGRRKSWLEGYMHSASLEHSTVLETRRNSIRRSGGHQSERRARTRSPAMTELIDQSKPARPNSFTNLGHNLACTLWKTFY